MSLVGWLAEKPRTPWEYMEQLLTDVGTARVEHRPKQLKPSLARLCRAMSADGKNEKKSNADFKWEELLYDEYPKFEEWLESKLSGKEKADCYFCVGNEI